ncbi:MAG: biotin carboxylase N-terminal domain-containing protein [Steroidobacteraceae bacterium]
MIRRLLIANRGEIACRIVATCRRLGIHSIAVYSEADRGARHVRLADEAHLIGPATASESYLNGQRIIEAALASGADAVHPGYGFLSEHAGFARSCAASGLVFVGPAPETIRLMGLKQEAKALAAEAGVDVLPGYYGEDMSPGRLATEAERVGFPLLVKAVAGGGGRGMRIVRGPEALSEALAEAGREALASFGDGRVMLERFIERPRHIEVQVFGDAHGQVVHLFDRECSVQRRHQKVIEEAPAPGLAPALRGGLADAAVRVARAARYVNAGTVEFVVAPDGRFYFLEMNTRLQVEHPVTEQVTGLDLVEWQLRVAAGEPLPRGQDALSLTGHAIEVRLCSEDPNKGFLPSTGLITQWVTPPAEATWRVEQGVESGDRITPFYDSLAAKLVASGRDRAEALSRLQRGLDETAVFGVSTNLALLRRVCAHPDFAAVAVDTTWLDRHLEALTAPPATPDPHLLLALADWCLPLGPEVGQDHSPWAMSDGWRLDGVGRRTAALEGNPGLRLVIQRRSHRLEVVVDSLRLVGEVQEGHRGLRRVTCAGETRDVFLCGHGAQVALGGTAGGPWRLGSPWPLPASSAEAERNPTSPLPGRVVAVQARLGEEVMAGQALAVVEGMKIQHTVRAGLAGRITRSYVAEGDAVEAEQVLFEISPA